MRISHPLDVYGRVFIEVRALPDGRVGVGVGLSGGISGGASIRSNLLSRVSLVADGKRLRLDAAGDGLVSDKGGGARPERLDLLLSGTTIGRYAAGADGFVASEPPRRLPTFLVKQAAIDGSGYLHDLSSLGLSGGRHPAFDPHSHLSGACSSDGLVRLGAELRLPYPLSFLRRVGIRIDDGMADSDGCVGLHLVDESSLSLLARAMESGVVSQTAFVDFERAYALRKPFVRSAISLPFVLRRIAEECASAGVRYVELSTSDAIGSSCFPPFMALARKALPAIEEETGTRLRFLAACKRGVVPETFDEDLARLRAFADDPLIVGMDLVGHETGSIGDFSEKLVGMASWARSEGVDWVFRVHAGESPRCPGNVAAVVAASEASGVPMRIGHAVYGASEELAERAAAAGCVVETCPTSNLALNNIHRFNALPFRTWMDAGVDSLPGTDGHGVIMTDVAQETDVLRSIGATEGDVARLCDRAEALIEAERRRSVRLGGPRFSRLPPPPVSSPHRFVSESALSLFADLGRFGAATLDDRDEFFDSAAALLDSVPSLRGRRPLLVSGSSVGRFPGRERDVGDFLRDLLAFVASGVDPDRTLFLTDGCVSEAETVVREEASSRGIPVARLLSADDSMDSPAAGVPSAVVLLRGGHSERMIRLLPLFLSGGAAIFAGGGSVVADEIRTLLNAGSSPILIRGVGGASSWNGKLNPSLAAFDGPGVCRALRYRGFPMKADAPW
jgi:adenosine deaminase